MKKAAFISILLAAAVALAAGCTNKEGRPNRPSFITVESVSATRVRERRCRRARADRHDQLVEPSEERHAIGSAGVCHRHARKLHGPLPPHGRRHAGPPDQNLPAGVIVPSGGSATLTNFPILPASQIQSSPFDQLLPFNGGFDRETGKDEIDMAFDIQFFGHTIAGQRVASEKASGPLNLQVLGGDRCFRDVHSIRGGSSCAGSPTSSLV